MIVTGLFLAEKATVIDGKLHVWGGVLDYWTVGADRIAEFGLVILVQAEPGDTDWTIGLELRSPNGAAVDLPSASCPDAEAGENRFACPPRSQPNSPTMGGTCSLRPPAVGLVNPQPQSASKSDPPHSDRWPLVAATATGPH